MIDRNWGALADVLEQLKAAGLDAIAEAPVDRIAEPRGGAADGAAAGLPVRSPVAAASRCPGSRTAYLLQVREIVTQLPWIHAVAPLPREQSIAVPTTGYDDVRTVALARLALPSVRNIEVDWTQYGPKLAQVALTFGANDLDRVVDRDDETLGRRRTSVEDVGATFGRRLHPAERDEPFDSQQGEAPPLAQDSVASWRGLVPEYETAGLRPRGPSGSIRSPLRRAVAVCGACCTKARSISV